ncbi:hypothetical protein [Cytophaga aurantiaca]|uniref:hypothetical protein n=1 Tax=Cytophaga aurantiaca TaxID=29530 RepID=UPI00036D6931|nr:hypothetical protein [Cytophaga aurantiaca]
MNVSVLDSEISKKSQLRIIIGLLCLKVLSTILINIVDTPYSESSDLQKIFFNISNALIFLHLYKYIRYDSKLKLFFAFISVEVLINIYYLALIVYKSIQGTEPVDTGFGSYEQTYPILVAISILRPISIIGIAIQLLLNKYFKKKIRIAIQLLGVGFLLQIIGPFVAVYLIGMLHGTTLESSIIENMYSYSYLFFTILPYISMVCLYVLALDQDDADVSTEEEL